MAHLSDGTPLVMVVDHRDHVDRIISVMDQHYADRCGPNQNRIAGSASGICAASSVTNSPQLKNITVTSVLASRRPSR